MRIEVNKGPEPCPVHIHFDDDNWPTTYCISVEKAEALVADLELMISEIKGEQAYKQIDQFYNLTLCPECKTRMTGIGGHIGNMYGKYYCPQCNITYDSMYLTGLFIDKLKNDEVKE